MIKKYGYARVSSRSQKEDRQLIALKENVKYYNFRLVI